MGPTRAFGYHHEGADRTRRGVAHETSEDLFGHPEGVADLGVAEEM